MPDRIQDKFQALIRRVQGTGTSAAAPPPERFPTEPTQTGVLAQGFEEAPSASAAAPSGTPSTASAPATSQQPAPLDVAALAQGVLTAATAFDAAADAVRRAETPQNHRALKEVEKARKNALFLELRTAVEALISDADQRSVLAGLGSRYLTLTNLGFYPLLENLSFRDAGSFLALEWMLRWKDPNRTDAAAMRADQLERAYTLRLIELHSYIYRSKLVDTLGSMLPLLRAKRGDEDEIATRAASWLGRLVGAFQASEFTGYDLVSVTAMRKIAAGLFAPASAGLNLGSAGTNGAALLEQLGYDWDRARATHAVGNPQGEARAPMLALLRHRSEVLDAILPQAIGEVMAQTPRDAHYQYVAYSSAGSETLTSDIDVNLKGVKTEAIVTRFNELFKAQYGYESGFVFDVNVYAQDYLPDPGLRFAAEDSPGEDLSFTSAQAARYASGYAAGQDALALLKVRRYVSQGDWAQFTELISGLLPPLHRPLFTTTVSLVANSYATVLAELDAARASATNALRAWLELADTDPLPEKAVEMAAANRCYEARLATVATKRAALRTAARGSVERDQLIYDLYWALGMANYQANEAYHSAGAARHVLGQMQMQTVRVGSVAELLASFNEQIGDSFKEFHHLTHDDPESALLVAPTWEQRDRPTTIEKKVCKYVSRYAHSTLSALVMILSALGDRRWGINLSPEERAALVPAELRTSVAVLTAIAAYGDALVSFKEERPVSDLGLIRAAAGITSMASLKERLLYVGALINGVVRSRMDLTAMLRLPALGNLSDTWHAVTHAP